jgi:ribosomal protein L11 methyltransferase
VKLIKAENWNQQWEASFQPVLIAGNVFIRADFHDPNKNARYDIVITPKMSFGTGHHETTMMMIEAMCDLDCIGKSFLDFGTGTGVLAIFAEKLGAESVTAIDCDSWSIANAKENIARNNCKRISLIQKDNIPTGNEYDVIVSNINKNIILDSFHEFSNGLKKGGALVVSGLLDSDLDEVNHLYTSYFGNPHLTLKKNNWVCLTFIPERIDR